MRTVPHRGPDTARLMVVGEAPGKTEVLRGYPFAGVTGNMVRSEIQRAGLDPDGDVLWHNVIPYNPGQLPNAVAAKAKIVVDNWETIDPELVRCKPKVIVACGWCAQYRLLGLREPVMDEMGGVHHESDVPLTTATKWGDRYQLLPKGALVIPTVHPAAVMRTKTMIGWLAVRRAIRRACAYACGELAYSPRRLKVLREPSYDEVDQALAAASEVVIDTEFDRNTYVPFMIGLTVNGEQFFSFTPNAAWVAILRRHFMRQDLVKIAHHHLADVQALARLGVDTRPPWFDTMLAFNTAFPGLKVGLENVAQFLLDDVKNWKTTMSRDDPQYNAIDVSVTWRCFQILRAVLAKEGLADVFEEEVMPAAPLAWGMEQRGLQICARTQEEEVARSDNRADRIRQEIKMDADRIFENRKLPDLKVLREKEQDLRTVKHSFVSGRCSVHPKYAGERKKKWAANEECCCGAVYEDQRVAILRGQAEILKKQIALLKKKISTWEARGFDPKNNHDLRWLLYDKKALALPEQKLRGKLTANADAIAKLISLKSVQNKEGVPKLLKKIKVYQHLRKMVSTFLTPPVDEKHIAHPPYRIHGTETGRPASGDEEVMGDKKSSRGAFNALNWPEECRVIVVPHQ